MRVDRRILRAALDPGLILRALYHVAAWPYLRMKARAFLRARPGHRVGEFEPPAMPFDATATAAIHARPGPYVLFAGVGLGEFVMMRRVAEALREARPDVEVGYALWDRGAIAAVRAGNPGLNVAWFADAYLPALRLLASQRPDVVVQTESYRVPFLVVASARFGARVALQNGRCRYRKSFDRPLTRVFYRWLFGAYAALAMQGDPDARGVQSLTRPGCAMRNTGNLKTDVRIAPIPDDRLTGLLDWLRSDLPLVAAGSTDNLGEETMVVDAFLRAREVAPCRLLLAPRHPDGAGQLDALLAEKGLTSARRTRGGGGDVLILDTQGELAHAYRACVAAYIGGSYGQNGGGHNPLEPLAWGLPVAFGMERGQFEAIQAALEERGVATRIADAPDLAAFWTLFLTDADRRERVGARAREVLEESRGAVAATVETLLPLLNPSPK